MSKMLLFLFVATFLFGEWFSIGPSGGYIYSLTSCENQSQNLYSLGYVSYYDPCPLYKTTDAGNSWTFVNDLQTGRGYVEVNAFNPDLIYYLRNDMYLSRSTDGGNNWQNLSHSGNYIYRMAGDPHNENRIMLAGSKQEGSYRCIAFFVSTNNGLTWISSIPDNSNSGDGYSIAFSHRDSNTVYLGGRVSSYPKVYKTTDYGGNWTDITSNITGRSYYVYSISEHPSNPNILLIAVGNSIWRTMDGGSNWQAVAYDGRFSSVIFASDTVAFACSDTAIYRSLDTGLTWGRVGTEIPHKYNIDLCLLFNSTVVLANNSGVFATEDFGTTWEARNDGIVMGQVPALAIDPLNDNIIYAALYGMGVYKSTDCGENWERLPEFLSCDDICEFAIPHDDPEVVFALEGKG